MPKPTFHNLPPDKRDRIVELAIEEFSERSFGEASLSRIVARAGIAKGSMYQYFSDKLDLYRWLMVDELARRKRAFVDAAVADEPEFFRRLAGSARAALRFAFAHPRLTRLAAAAALPAAEPALRAIHAEVHGEAEAVFIDMVRSAQSKGQVRKDIDPALAGAVLFAGISQGLQQGLARLGVDLRALAPDHPAVPEALEQIVEQIVDMVRIGLRPREVRHAEGSLVHRGAQA